MGLWDVIKGNLKQMSMQGKNEDLRTRLDIGIIRLARSRDEFDNYYGLYNATHTNIRILKIENRYIDVVFGNYEKELNKHHSVKEIEEMKAEFVERAELWHDLREDRAGFTKENLDRLIELEGDFYDRKSFDELSEVNFEINGQPIRETSTDQIEQGEETISLNKFLEKVKLKKEGKSQGEGTQDDKSRLIGNGQERDR